MYKGHATHRRLSSCKDGGSHLNGLPKKEEVNVKASLPSLEMHEILPSHTHQCCRVHFGCNIITKCTNKFELVGQKSAHKIQLKVLLFSSYHCPNIRIGLYSSSKISKDFAPTASEAKTILSYCPRWSWFFTAWQMALYIYTGQMALYHHSLTDGLISLHWTDGFIPSQLDRWPYIFTPRQMALYLHSLTDGLISSLLDRWPYIFTAGQMTLYLHILTDGLISSQPDRWSDIFTARQMALYLHC